MRTLKKFLKTADISRRHFNYLLLGERNATASTARRIERASGMPKELWVFGTSMQRKAALKKYLSGANGK